MPKNVMKLLKPSPHRARNDFDLSHRHVFDANFGELLPATCIETVPGDNITLHASDLLRAIPFVSSPFLRAKQHLDVWFVPYHDLWHQFDAFITRKSEPVSSAFNSAVACPWVNQYTLYSSINYYSGQGVTDITGRVLSDRSYYLLQLLGYGDILNSHGQNDSGSTAGSYRVNPFRLAAYNYIWYNEYRQQYYDDGSRLLPSSNNNPANLFNFDRLSCDSVANAKVDNTNWTGALLAAMCQMRYRCWKKDLFTGVLPSTQFGLVSTLNGGSVSGLTGSFSGTAGNVSVNGQMPNHAHGFGAMTTDPDYWTTTDPLTGDPVPHGTWDDGSGSALHDSSGSVGTEGFADGTGALNYSFSNSAKIGQTRNLSHVHGLSSGTTGQTGGAQITSTGTFTPQGTITLNTSSGSLSFDILSLRHAEALQIWRENALRAGNHIKDNMLAHYGVASDFNDHRPVYLGSVSAPLNIGDIATTANSSSGINNTVGDVAGKGLSSLSEKVFKFHAKDFGVIMVMFSMLPEAEYDAIGIERTNQLLEQEDFFMPEFENLGLEAVDRINLGSSTGIPPASGTAYGFAPRYFGYKTKLDKCFGQFTGNGVFRTWTSQRSDVTTFVQGVTATVPLNLLYVNPAIYDANFNVGIANSPQFLCDVYFDVDAVRPMSVVGLPFS